MADESGTFTRLRALYSYQYTDDDGRLVVMSEGDEYILLKKTSEDWWHVLKLNERLPFYVPANYVEVTYTPKSKSTDGSEDEGEASDDGILSMPALPDKKEKSRTLEQRPKTPTEVSERSRTFPSDARKVTSPTVEIGKESGQVDSRKVGSPTVEIGTQNMASVLAQEAQKMKRFSFRPVDGADVGPRAPPGVETRAPPGGDVADYVNLQDYQKAAGIGIHAQPSHAPMPDPAPSESEYMNLATIQQSITSTAPAKPPPDLKPTKVLNCGWAMYTDEQTLRTYFYNSVSGDTSWKPPRPSLTRSDSRNESESEDHVTQRSARDSVKKDLVGDYYGRIDGGKTVQESPGVEEGPQIEVPQIDVPRIDAGKRETVGEGLYGRIDGAESRLGNGETKSSDDSLNSSREECEVDGSEERAPKGYTTETSADGQIIFTNTKTSEKWLSSVDSEGKRYYYQDGGESVWSLPELTGDQSPRKTSLDSAGVKEIDEVRRLVAQRSTSDRHLRAKSMMATLNDSHFTPGNRNLASSNLVTVTGVNKRSPVAANDSNTTSRFDLEDLVTIPRPDGAYSLIVKPPERRGVVYKTKIMDGGKRVNKKWTQTYLVLSGPSLLFYKDQKASLAKAGKPDAVVDLCDAQIDWASKDVTSRRNVLQVSSGSSVYLLQLDDGLKAHEWSVALRQSHDFSRQLVSDLPSWELNRPPPKQAAPAPVANKFKRSKSTKAFTKTNPAPTDDQNPSRSKIRERLLNFFLKRPALEVLQEKGIIKNSVFGAHIAELCEREGSTIPRFVRDCVTAIEIKGLTVDGIYRHSGNLATIQKLRFIVDQNDPYDLLGEEWDLHVLTGSLKLFFRELREPVFPFQFYQQFCRASTLRDEAKKRDAVRDLVSVLPKPNYDTLKFLFNHLHKVIDQSSENRMQVQSVAIVFGPTLMWPENENANMAVNTVIQNQIIELVLTNSHIMFPS